jgi:hypothetical protein
MRWPTSGGMRSFAAMKPNAKASTKAAASVAINVVE